MSAFYILYLSDDSKNNYEQIKETIIDLISSITHRDNKIKLQILEDNDNQLCIWCDNFWLRFKNGGQQVEFRSEDYKIKLKYQFSFDVYTEYSNWFNGLISFVGQIIARFDGDCIFESNGDTPIIMRLNNVITIDKRYLTQEQVRPLVNMGLIYNEGELPKV